jgi:ABC-2 type transport system permease protein
MTAVMGTGLAPAQAKPTPATVAGPVTQVRVVRAEWTKLRALRSTRWCALTAAVLIVGLGALVAGSGTAYHVSAGNTAANGVSVALLGVLFAQLVIGVVGVLALSGEYGTGMIRATLRTVVGSSLYLTVVVIIGLALGALLRKTAAGLSVFAAVFFVIPVTVGVLPPNIKGFAPYLPSNADGALWGSPLNATHPLSPWTGFACLCGYAIVLTALAAWQLRRRDA